MLRNRVIKIDNKGRDKQHKREKLNHFYGVKHFGLQP